MLKLCVGINRKEGRPDFGSAGASLSMEFEIAATPGDAQAIAEQVKAAYDMLNALVDDELVRATTPQNGHSNGAAAPGRISRSSHPTKTKGDRAPSVTLRDDRPKSGRELYPWSKNQESRGVIGLVRFLESFGAERGFPRRFTDWSRDEVDAGYEAALDKFNPPTY